MSIKSNGKFRGDNKTILKATAGLTNPIMSDNVITVEVGTGTIKASITGFKHKFRIIGASAIAGGETTALTVKNHEQNTVLVFDTLTRLEQNSKVTFTAANNVFDGKMTISASAVGTATLVLTTQPI